MIVAEYSEIEGQVEPNLVVATCLELATRAGAITRYETANTGFFLTHSTNQIHTVHTTGGDLHSDLFVMAAGVYTTELALMLEIAIP